MHKYYSKIQSWLLLILLSISTLLQGCTNFSSNVPHGFSFYGSWGGLRGDGWAETVDLLAYDYGGKYSMVRNDVDNPNSPIFKNLKALPSAKDVNGPMPVGEYLYVRWRLKKTGEVLEDRVDLRDRLPSNMFGQNIIFVIDEKQLYVYLVTNKPNTNQSISPVLKTFLSKSYVTYEIYPNNNRP